LILHLAAAFDVPATVFYSHINNHHNWVLKKDNIIVIEFDPQNLNNIDLNDLHNFI